MQGDNRTQVFRLFLQFGTRTAMGRGLSFHSVQRGRACCAYREDLRRIGLWTGLGYRRTRSNHSNHSTPPRRVERSGVLRSSIQTGSQVRSPTGHVRRAFHSTGRVLALAALRGVPGTFERAQRNKFPAAGRGRDKKAARFQWPMNSAKYRRPGHGARGGPTCVIPE